MLGKTRISKIGSLARPTSRVLSKPLGLFNLDWLFIKNEQRCKVNDHGVCDALVSQSITLYNDPIGDPVRIYACRAHAVGYFRHHERCTS